jgi:NADPH:quinone reductase-like Zn-dependent oxidoreductase
LLVVRSAFLARIIGIRLIVNGVADVVASLTVLLMPRDPQEFERKMKAINYHRYGPPDVLEYVDIEEPTPADHELLIRVHATSVNPLDWHLMRGTPYVARTMMGLRKPKEARLGADVAGQVAAVGTKVNAFQPGDEVFGALPAGAFAEYACAPESAMVTKPAKVTYQQAGSTPVAAITALQALRDKGQIQPGQKVLINGAAGGVGTFAVQIAKWVGADVTGVCSTRNVAMLRSIGADHVIDYTREDFTRRNPDFDLILDIVASRPLSACRRVLKRKGTYVAIGGPDGRWIGPLADLIKPLLLSPFVSQRLIALMAKPTQTHLTLLGQLLDTGRIKAVVDRRYSLRELPQAIAYLEQGHASGKVVITVP